MYSTAQTLPANTFWGQSTPQGYQYKVTPTSPTYQIPAYNSSPQTPKPTQIGSSTGGVLGTSTQSTGLDPHINPSTGLWDDNYYQSQQQSNVSALQNQQRQEITSGYDNYFNELNNSLNNFLPEQKLTQEQIAQSQFDQGLNSLDTQKTLGQQDLAADRVRAESEQKKNLQDLTSNLTNLFQSGNVYLGARGAGDSSASNQYAYALTKMGGKQRSDLVGQYANIQNDISGREARLNEIYSSQKKDLEFTLNQQISGIAQWFANAQNQIRQAQAQGQLSKGQDLASLTQNALNYALSQLQTLQQEAVSKRQALDQWAISNATNINQLKQNLAQVSDVNYSMPQASQLSGLTGNGQIQTPSLFGYGSTTDTKKNNIFGQPIA